MPDSPAAPLARSRQAEQSALAALVAGGARLAGVLQVLIDEHLPAGSDARGILARELRDYQQLRRRHVAASRARDEARATAARRRSPAAGSARV